MSESLTRLIAEAECECVGWDGFESDIHNEAHLRVLQALVQGYRQDSGVTLLAEPSLVRSAHRPPDLVVLDPTSGVHVLEVKGVPLEDIEGVTAGEIRVRYKGRSVPQNPIRQVRTAMFDIKNSVERILEAEAEIPFLWWVVFASISREDYRQKFSLPDLLPELLFEEDVAPDALVHRMRETGGSRLKRWGKTVLTPEDLAGLRKAFGDSAVLQEEGRDRGRDRDREGGRLGDDFDEIAARERRLSGEQQKLAAGDWRGGPRLIRGVAGSGKTVVLATHLARRLARSVHRQKPLFAEPGERFLAVCFNRTLVPFIRMKIHQAYRQRTGEDFPEDRLEVTHFNRLLHTLDGRSLWKYKPVEKEASADQLAKHVEHYRNQLAMTRRDSPELVDQVAYDVVYVDEAQDLLPDEIRLLGELCKVPPGGGLPEVYIFYDDAQNLYGRPRPTWEKLGVKMVGRSHVMVECFRNTRQIVEVAFNVLLGSTAAEGQRVKMRQFADTNYLEKDRKVIEQEGGFWRVKFAERAGAWPGVHILEDRDEEDARITDRLRWLMEDQDVRPEDILVLGSSRKRLRDLAGILENHLHVAEVLLPFEAARKDDYITRKNCLTVSTINSAKGYDAFCVLIVSANEFALNREGRAAFYVGCTRARERLDVFAHEDTGLAQEFRLALEALRGN